VASFKKLETGWQYRVSYKKDGKYKTKSANGFSTKKEAQIAAAAVDQQLHKGYNINAGDKLFRVYFEEWYEIYRKGKKSKDNDNDIRRAVEFAAKAFPDTKLKELTRDEYQKALNHFGKDRASATVKKHHTYMKACLQDAIQDGVIFKDPTYRVIAKGLKDPKQEELKYLNYKDTVKLIGVITEGIKPTYISRYIILFGLATGCRYSEIIGLTWDCIDFKNKTVKIEKTWDYKYTEDFSNAKNYQSKRVITIDDDTLVYLKQLKHHQNQFFLRNGLKNEKNLVFMNENFELVSNNAVNKTLRKFCKKVNIKEITCHGLRHTHASILLYQNINIKYVSRRLGHIDITTTLKVYQHVLDELSQRENDVVSHTIKKMYAGG
jgi:integrase